MMFNFHTHFEDEVPCLVNSEVGLPGGTEGRLPGGTKQHQSCVHLSVGLHPWNVEAEWEKMVSALRCEASKTNVWAIGECGLDKARGGDFSCQIEAFKAQIQLAEEMGKPVVVHCVKAMDELLALRKELVAECKRLGKEPQPWILHGFRGKPEQAKQIMAKGIFLSFGHQYNIDSLRFAYKQAVNAIVVNSASSAPNEAGLFTSCPFFLETDDLHLSVRQIYEQVGHHLGVDVCHLESLCDPLRTVFCRSCR